MRKYLKFHYFKIIIIYTLLSVAFIFLILKFGITVAVKVSEFLQKNQPGLDTEITEKYIPAPQLNSTIEATNSAQLIISGFSTANREVKIVLNNDEPVIATADADGKFEQEISLSLGTNTVKAFVEEDKSKSSDSNILQIYYNDVPPKLEITEPENNKTFKKNPFVDIKGKTDKNCKVYVNDHMIITDNDGNYSTQVKLNVGENTFKIVSIDPAKNKTEKEIKLNYRNY